jgi:ABC-type phosphate transport system substrate-binding protein
LFYWYYSDFGNNDKEVIEFVEKFLDDDQKKILNKMKENGYIKINYNNYDWDSNSK